MKELRKTGVTVEQEPVFVIYVCPYCNEEVDVSYDIFCRELGDNPDEWGYSILQCQECEEMIKIDSVDWY